jgi:predicted anti-sigma-YlaC factor YlaD
LTCPKEIMLQSYSDGELAAWRANQIQIHLRNCVPCRHKVDELNRLKLLFAQSFEPELYSLSQAPLVRKDRRVWNIMAAAMVLVALACTGMWYQWHVTESFQPELELIDEYLQIHCETGFE